MKMIVMLILLGAAIVAPNCNGAERLVNTASSGTVTAPPFRSTTMTVYLPPGAQVTKVHYIHLGLDGVWKEVSPNYDIQWAMILPGDVQSMPNGGVVVTATLKNWSHNLIRSARLAVDWLPPNR